MAVPGDSVLEGRASHPVDESCSRGVVVLTGLSYLFVGLGFSYLDRQYGSLGLEAFLWCFWTVLGFGAGPIHVGKSDTAGRAQWMIMAGIGLFLALTTGLVLYRALRLLSLLLMVLIGARAAVLKTRRDFHLTLTGIFVVSFLVGTHGNAEWSLWFYLGPAWVFAGLALTWDHCAGSTLSRWIKTGMAFGFIGVAFLLAVMLFFLAPRPPVLGFGFLPPGTETPGLFSRPAGSDGVLGGAGSGRPQGSGQRSGGGQGGAGTDQAPSQARRWGDMLKYMDSSLRDEHVPAWQRKIMRVMMDAAHATIDWWSREPKSPPGQGDSDKDSAGEQARNIARSVPWLPVLALLLAMYTLWRYRYRLGISLLLGCSWLLIRRDPQLSMRLSARAMTWCLIVAGHRKEAGQSVREHWLSAPGLAPLARRWCGFALDVYGSVRFGGVAARPQQAADMRQAVVGASEIISGAAPELAL